METKTAIFDERGFIEIEGNVFDDPAEARNYSFSLENKTCNNRLILPIITIDFTVKDNKIIPIGDIKPFGNVLAFFIDI